MPHWEYRKINLNELLRKTDDIDVLTDAGAKGWELVAIAPNNIAYLKRPLEDPPGHARSAAGRARHTSESSGRRQVTAATSTAQ